MAKRKNILITGASSGLGKGMALEFAKQGCNLALCARRVENLEELKKEILQKNPNCKVFLRPLDVNIAEDVFTTFKAFNEDFKGIGGSLDRVIVNAGMGKGASMGKGRQDANMQTANTNFIAAISQFEAALEIFREQNHGHVVAMASVSAFRGLGGAATVYAATKAAIANLAEGARVDLIGKPIKVSTIYPGYIQSEITDAMKKQPPFTISLKKGANLLVKAINKEKDEIIVPKWPWLLFKILMPIMPLKVLRWF